MILGVKGCDDNGDDAVRGWLVSLWWSWGCMADFRIPMWLAIFGVQLFVSIFSNCLHIVGKHRDPLGRITCTLKCCIQHDSLLLCTICMSSAG